MRGLHREAKVLKGNGTQPKYTESNILLTELKACSKARNLEWGRKVHAKALQKGSASSIHVATALVNMYAKCGSMVEAHRVFDSITKPDVVSWTALLLGYAYKREGHVTLDLFSKMKSQGCMPDCMTYVAALKACTSLAVKEDACGKAKCLERGKQIHSEIGCHLDRYVQSTLIDMYAKCGSMADAHRAFDSIKHPSVVSWNALLLGYAEVGEGLAALDLFSRMKSENCAPDSITYMAVLKACASVAAKAGGSQKAWCLEYGKQIHLEIDCHMNPYVESMLIDMYAKCGSMVEAHRVFVSITQPDVVSWNTLLLGYADNGEGFLVLDLFSRLKSQGCAPDSVTYVAALKACASLAEVEESTGKAGCLEKGREIHLEVGCHLNLYVQNTLIDMYAKCGSMKEAHQVFDTILQLGIVSWNALLLGYVENGQGSIALDLFWKMKAHGCEPDSVTYVAALKACRLLGVLEFGQKVHAEVREFDAMLVTSLVDFYAKSGRLEEAQQVFDVHSKTRTVTTWTALLAGYSSIGDTDSVFRVFKGMQDAGIQPDGVTFQCILMSCSHAGFVGKARECFRAMSVTPTLEHFNCMVDVFGRANKLDDAIVLLAGMPCISDGVTWMAVLDACRMWKNVEVGSLAFQCLLSLDERNAAAYTLMAQIYTSRGMWEEQEMVLTMRRKVSLVII